MAELKIKADSGGGTVSLKGPATTTSNAAVQLTLPVDDGAADQYLKTDGSGALSWGTVAQQTNASNLSSGTLPAARIADDSIVEAKLDIHAAPSGTNKFLGYTSNGMEWAVPPDTDNGWAEHVYFNKDGDLKNCSTNTWAKVTIDAGYQRGTSTGQFDATNSRYTPGVAGWYLVQAEVVCHHNGSGSWWHIEVRKNNSGVGIGHSVYPHTVNGLKIPLGCCGIIDLDSDDYLEIFINQSTGGTRGVDDIALSVVRVGTNS